MSDRLRYDTIEENAEAREAGSRLSAMTNESSEKIEELRRSVESLLVNMPALTFSKDVEHGKYLACNQKFAEYAHKETPAGVVGLTDFDIFDHETAAHFVEDDKKALSMDRPHVFYEDVPDAAGNQRQFQTTKLKFTDTSGRLCLLGMCVDITEILDEMESVKEEKAKVQEAYEKARFDSATYSGIVRGFISRLHIPVLCEYGNRRACGIQYRHREKGTGRRTARDRFLQQQPERCAGKAVPGRSGYFYESVYKRKYTPFH